MRNLTCQPLIRTLLEHHAAGQAWRTEPTTIAADRYTSPAHLGAEKSALFRGPQVVALSADLPTAGSTLVRDHLGVPTVLTRDDAGRVHALINVCAHRAAQVVTDERACTRRLTCPYHAWTYDLGGRLVGLPDRVSFPDVEVPGPGLRPLPVLEEHGLVWVTPMPGAALPQAALGAFAEDFDSYDVSSHRHWRSHRFDLALNWKLVIDTFLEPYHFSSLHRNTVAPYFLANLCLADRSGSHVREVLPRPSLPALADQPPDTWDLVAHSVILYVLFPNTVFVKFDDHIETWRVHPDAVDPGRSVCDLDFYVPDVPATPSSEGHWERNWKLTIDTVEEEDFAAMAGVQRGLASGTVDHLRVGANEPALGLFHAALDECLAGARPR